MIVYQKRKPRKKDIPHIQAVLESGSAEPYALEGWEQGPYPIGYLGVIA